MNPELLILVFTPFFALFFLLEIVWNYRSQRATHHWCDSFTNLSCGIGSQIIGIYSASMQLVIYSYLYTNHSLNLIDPNGIWVWIFGYLSVDFLYYWFHRVSHERNMFWAFHGIHHQSEKYNLSVALRQSWLGGFVSWVFYLPLAIIGLSPQVFIFCLGLNLIYQFFIHTEAVGRLGVLESFLNTPSHHRVHHGINDDYLNKNYAGTFIFWDRMLGTFQKEVDKVDYGLVVSLKDWRPFQVNFIPLLQLFADLKDPNKGIKSWFMNPGWLRGDRGHEQAIIRAKKHEETRIKFSDIAKNDKKRMTVVTVVALVSSIILLAYQTSISKNYVLVASIAILGLLSLEGRNLQKSYFKKTEP
ncbi:sterol desaturase family protein [Oligoflexaceae bacterium]|nr:sterol desaturase family protein [Oligoflexaceae bacterium]